MSNPADTIEISRPLLRGLVAQLERDGQDPTDSVLVLKHILRHGRRPNASEMIAGAAADGKTQLAAHEAIAAAGLEEYAANATPERAPNATAVIADSCVDGHRRLAALKKIATGNRP
jgi:hypothetical protein